MSNKEDLCDSDAIFNIREIIGNNCSMSNNEVIDHIRKLQEIKVKAELAVESNYFKPACFGLESAIKNIR